MPQRSTPKGYNGKPQVEFLVPKETPARHRSNKDTKRWCGGKPGREHVPYWESKYYQWKDKKKPGVLATHVNQTFTCIVCGKKLKFRFKTMLTVDGVTTVQDGWLW